MKPTKADHAKYAAKVADIVTAMPYVPVLDAARRVAIEVGLEGYHQLAADAQAILDAQ